MTIDAVVERIAEGGNLLRNLGLLQDISTWETSIQVWRAWQKGTSVEGVSTANMGIYRLVDGNAVFDLLGKEGNLFIDPQFREDAYKGILGNEFFFPQDEMKQRVLSAISAKHSVSIQYSGLNVKTEGCSPAYGFILAGKDNSDEEKKLFFAVYGTDDPGKGKRVYLLRENVVKEQLRNRNDDFIARACYFNYGQNFNANDRNIDYYLGAVRGVRRVRVAEGDTQKNDPLTYAYTTILAGVDKLPAAKAIKLYNALHPAVINAASRRMEQ